MTKKLIKELQDVQGRLIKGIAYIKKDSVFICSDTLPNGLSFYNKEGKGITPMNKEVGSELAYIYTALYNLTEIILSEQKIIIPITTN